jgi:N6-adenosine-specific RNA methylase IME4
MTRDPPLFAPLPVVAGGFACVHAEPPIRFRSNSRERPGRNAMRHYRCYDYPDFESLPVADVLADDALLALWVPSPFLAVGTHIPLIKAWGFDVSSIGFNWLKVNRDGSPRMGPGMVTRKCCEFAVIGRRGKPQRLSKGVLEIIIAEPREHSRKPEEIYRRLEALTPGPRLDLFARQRRENWVVYRDQSSRFNFEGPAERMPLKHAMRDQMRDRDDERPENPSKARDV